MPSDRIMRYSLYGGIITGATLGLPVLDFLNCFCCAGIILGGFLAVFFAIKDLDPSLPPVSRSDCLQLGVFSGLFGAFIGAVFHAIVMLIAGDVVLETISSMIRDGDLEGVLPPGLLDQIWGELDTQEGFSVVDILIHFLFWIVLGPLFGLIGGLLGFSLLQRRPPVQFVPPQSPTSLP